VACVVSVASGGAARCGRMSCAQWRKY